MKGKRVLITGLHPAVVDYKKWPGLTAEKLEGAINGEQAALREQGYRPDVCLFDMKQPAESVLQKKLTEGPFDCVMIGAGVRTDKDHFFMFEKLVNVVHQHAPTAKICFNTNPGDTAEAVNRWI